MTLTAFEGVCIVGNVGQYRCVGCKLAAVAASIISVHVREDQLGSPNASRQTTL